MCADKINRHPAERLYEKHQQALHDNDNWLSIWNLFIDDPWIQQQLGFLTTRVAKAGKICSVDQDDLRQNALVEFAANLRRDPSLGYESEKGRYQSLISTILYRCCLKAQRQFKFQVREESVDYVLESDYQSDFQPQQDSLDLLALIDQLAEPHRKVASLYTLGKSVEEIAASLQKSKRTAYRMLQEATKMLRKLADSGESG